MPALRIRPGRPGDARRSIGERAPAPERQPSDGRGRPVRRVALPVVRSALAARATAGRGRARGQQPGIRHIGDPRRADRHRRSPGGRGRVRGDVRACRDHPARGEGGARAHRVGRLEGDADLGAVPARARGERPAPRVPRPGLRQVLPARVRGVPGARHRQHRPSVRRGPSRPRGSDPRAAPRSASAATGVRRRARGRLGPGLAGDGGRAAPKRPRGRTGGVAPRQRVDEWRVRRRPGDTSSDPAPDRRHPSGPAAGRPVLGGRGRRRGHARTGNDAGSG